MRFISLFSGVGGFDLGMEKAGHECVAQVEWNEHAGGVLKKHWADVPLFCDVTKVTADDLPDADFVCYGFPCQDLSQAGKRAGLSGKRSGLFYESVRLFRELLRRGSGLRFAVAENVEGLLSADDGCALAGCIRELLDCGASEVGWRVLDSQYFGIPQRRRRVFLVSDFGSERGCANEILAIEKSLRGYSPPKRREESGTPAESPKGVGVDVYNGLETGDTAATLTSASGIPNASGPKVLSAFPIQGTMIGRENPSMHGSGHGDEGDPMYTLDTVGTHGVAVYENHPSDARVTEAGDVCPTITQRCGTGGGNLPLARDGLLVRKLMPLETERLQGFPDGWTESRMGLELVGNEWKPTGEIHVQADSHRYIQMGNAVSVPVAKWLGDSISEAMGG